MKKKLKYKTGQQVMVHPELATKFDQRETPTINHEMRQLAGKIITIQETDNPKYTDNPRYYASSWSWLEKWLLPVTMDEKEAFEKLVKGEISSDAFEEMTRTT